MKRRDFLVQAASGLASSGLAAIASLPVRRSYAAAPVRVLRMIHSLNLQSLDPIWTTAPATKDYGFLTYDQLIAVDTNYVPRPQMAEGWVVEDDGRSYLFKLRDGLRFHDGVPVRSQDCIASIRRWSARDGFGQALAKRIDAMQVIDDRRFRIRLKQPSRLLLAALGKASASECFIMPERVANTDPMHQITECIGSGPYRFLRDEWVSGSHASWAKFDGYIPRSEPVSGLAGARIPAMDRIEWSIISDPSTALAALQSGEQDFWDMPPADLLPALRDDPNIVVDVRDRSGVFFMLQFNHLQPPFNDLRIRQAVAMATDQTSLLQAVTSDALALHPCRSFFPCGTPYGDEAGGGVLAIHSVAKARQALKEAGYGGEKLVLLAAMDAPGLAAMSQVTQSMLQQIGMNVELVATDFAGMAQRRTNRGPVAEGGWSCFVTAWTGADIVNPAVNQLLRASGATGWFGWPQDKALEDLRARWFDSNDAGEQTQLAMAIQTEAFKTLPYLPLGASTIACAYSRKVKGVFPSPAAAYWNISKTA